MNILRTLTRRGCVTALTIGAVFLAAQQTGHAATLVHRYTFNEDAITTTTIDNGDGTFTTNVTSVADVIAGSAWDGALPYAGTFSNVVNDAGTVTNGEVSLAASYGQYIEFPPGIISNYPAITVDAWATISNPWGFLWAFGDTRDSDGLGGNAAWLHCRARLTITDTMPSWGGEQNAFFDPLDNRGYIHITAVIDPPTQRLLVYTNGILAGINNAETRSLTNVYSIHNYIAKSVFSGDGLIDLTMDEFRIWNGALNGIEVAGCDVAGPDAIGSAASVGTLTNLTVTVPYVTLVQGGHEIVSVTGSATLFTNQIAIDNNLCTYTSGNTGVLTVDTNGLIAAVRPGATTVTAHYGTASGSVTITVFPEPISLAHRWTFNETTGTTVADSVGGPSWDGTLPNGGTLADGQVSLLGANQEYVEFPTNIFSGMTNVTFDLWFTTQAAIPWNAWLFGFGDTVNSDHGANYFFVQPQSGRFVMAGVDPGWAGEQAATAAFDFSSNTNLHITCVACTGGGYLAIYTNGVLAGINNSLTYSISSIHDNYSYINRSLYPSDPYVDLTVNEFRIYSGAMSPEQVAINQALGPDILVAPKLSVASVGSNVIVSWPTNASGFTVVSRESLNAGSWAPVGVSPVISGTNNQVTLPITSTAQFFGLSK